MQLTIRFRWICQVSARVTAFLKAADPTERCTQPRVIPDGPAIEPMNATGHQIYRTKLHSRRALPDPPLMQSLHARVASGRSCTSNRMQVFQVRRLREGRVSIYHATPPAEDFGPVAQTPPDVTRNGSTYIHAAVNTWLILDGAHGQDGAVLSPSRGASARLGEAPHALCAGMVRRPEYHDGPVLLCMTVPQPEQALDKTPWSAEHSRHCICISGALHLHHRTANTHDEILVVGRKPLSPMAESAVLPWGWV